MKKILLFLPFLLFFAGCSENNNSSDSAPTLHVQVQPIIKKDVPFTINSFGYLTEYLYVAIKPEVTGQVKSVKFEEGAHAKKGDLLFIINPEKYLAQLEANEAGLKQAEADYSLKKYIADKNKKLSNSGAIAMQDYKKMEADLNSALASIESYSAAITSNKIDIKNCYIKAPISGVIGLQNIDIGNIVSGTDVLCDIRDTSKLYVDFMLPEKYITEVKEGIESKTAKVKIHLHQSTLDDSVALDYPAELTFVNNSVDTKSGSIMLRAMIDNNKEKLTPGQFVNIKLTLGKQKNVLLVPQAGVQVGSGGKYIYVVKGDIAKKLYIKAEQQYKAYYVLESNNLTENEKVLVTGLDTIIDGEKVTTQEVKGE